MVTNGLWHSLVCDWRGMASNSGGGSAVEDIEKSSVRGRRVEKSSGMTVTSTKQYSTDGEERTQIRRRDIFAIIGEQSIKSNAFRHFEMVKSKTL